MEDEFLKLQRELQSDSTLGKELCDRENTYHPSTVLFGEALVDELLNVVPELIKEAEDQLELVEYLEALTKKKSHLERFMKGIEHKVAQGEIDQEKYIKYLESCLKANQNLLNKIPQDLIQDIERIQK